MAAAETKEKAGERVVRVRKVPRVGTTVPDTNEGLGRVYVPMTSNQAFYDAVAPRASMCADGHAVAAAGISYSSRRLGSRWHVRADSMFDFSFWMEFDVPIDKKPVEHTEVRTIVSSYGRVCKEDGSDGAARPDWIITVVGDLESFSITSKAYHTSHLRAWCPPRPVKPPKRSTGK
jgi:hypothetical protein